MNRGIALGLVILIGGGAAAQWDDFAPSTPSSDPQDLTTAEGRVYFTAADGVHGRELWATDGEAAWLVKDVVPGPNGSEPKGITAAGDRVFFAVDIRDATPPIQLWYSDGTEAGTGPLLDGEGVIQTIDYGFAHRLMAFFAGDLYFVYPGADGQWLRRVRLENLAVEALPLPKGVDALPRITELIVASDRLFCPGALNSWVPNVEETRMIWTYKADGRLLQQTLGLNFAFDFMAVMDDKLVFRGRERSGALGREPWITDGAPDGAFQLFDVNPGSGDGISDFANAGALGGRTFFNGNSELWVTDGTTAGTRLFYDCNPGPRGSNPGRFVRVGDRLFFQAHTETHGHEMWVTDGTTEGTRLLKDIYPGPRDGNTYRPIAAGSWLYFSVNDPIHGEELWRSDGTPEGTVLVKDIAEGPTGSSPYYKAVLGDRVVFTANDGRHGTELWITDGTAEGTRLLKDISPERGPNLASNPDQLIVCGDLLFFVLNHGKYGVELWRSDGTEQGTFLVRDIYPGHLSSGPAEFAVAGNWLLFQADDGVHGVELWMSDGTEQGTFIAFDLNPGPASSNPHGLTVWLGPSDADGQRAQHLAVAANDGVSGVEPHLFNIREHAVDLLVSHDLRPGPEGSDPRHFALRDAAIGLSTIFFTADDGVRGAELWKWDWSQPPALVSDIINNYRVGSHPISIVSNGRTVFFTADDGARGAELWRTDGAPETTRIVRDIVAE